jgi:hypothetical protein
MLECGIHNPKPRKFSTLLTETGCSHSVFIGVLMILYAAILPASPISESPSQHRHNFGPPQTIQEGLLTPPRLLDHFEV